MLIFMDTISSLQEKCRCPRMCRMQRIPLWHWYFISTSSEYVSSCYIRTQQWWTASCSSARWSCRMSCNMECWYVSCPGLWLSVILLGVRRKEHIHQVLAISVTVHLKCVLVLEEYLLGSIKYMKCKSFGTLRELCPTILSPSASLVANETAAFWFQALTYF